MIVPGAYFRDETIWRGRVAAFTCDLKAALYELGFWVGLLYVAAYVSLKWEFVPLAVGTAVCLRMVIGFVSEMEERKRITKDIEQHFEAVGFTKSPGSGCQQAEPNKRSLAWRRCEHSGTGSPSG